MTTNTMLSSTPAARGKWKWPANSRKAHWFAADPVGVGEEPRSACGKWLYTGPACETQGSPAEKPCPDDCAPCWRALKKAVANA